MSWTGGRGLGVSKICVVCFVVWPELSMSAEYPFSFLSAAISLKVTATRTKIDQYGVDAMKGINL